MGSWLWQPLIPLAAAEPAESTHAPFIVRVPFRPLGRNPYVWHDAHDLSVVEPLDLPHVVRSRPLRPLGRNPYLHHYAQDESFVPPAEPETLAPHLVRIPFRRLGANRYVWHASIEGPVEFNDAAAGFLVVPTWDGYRLARASRYVYHHAAFLDAPLEPSTFAAFVVRVPFKALHRSRYLYHYAQDESSAAATVPAWANRVNIVFNAYPMARGVSA